MTETMAGKSLVQSLDCKACHKETEKSIGPAYTAVAQRYQKDAGATLHLVNKIIKGGAGAWGETAMPAHPDLKEGDAHQIVSWILSLTDDGKKQKSLPVKGTIKPTLDKKPTDNGVFVLSASYMDKGTAGIKPLPGNNTIVLRSSSMSMATVRNLKGYTIQSFSGRQFMMVPAETASFSLDSIDLTGITSLELRLAGNATPKYGFVFELRLDAPDGKKMGKGALPAGTKYMKGAGGYGFTILNAAIAPVTDKKLHNLYIVSKALNQHEGLLISTSAQFKAN